MSSLANGEDHGESGNKSFEKSLEDRYREAMHLDYPEEELSQMARVLAFLKELGRSPFGAKVRS